VIKPYISIFNKRCINDLPANWEDPRKVMNINWNLLSRLSSFYQKIKIRPFNPKYFSQPTTRGHVVHEFCSFKLSTSKHKTWTCTIETQSSSLVISSKETSKTEIKHVRELIPTLITHQVQTNSQTSFLPWTFTRQ
jgi:hypothetical protein